MAQGVPFTPEDLAAMTSRGVDPADVAAQLVLFRQPPPPARLDRPCTVGDGIVRLGPDGEHRLLEAGRRAAGQGRLLKFVPASGAASRMFAALLEWLAAARERAGLTVTLPPPDQELRQFLQELPRFAFAEELAHVLSRRGEDLERLRLAGIWPPILEALLQERGLNLAGRPKGLIPFHRYPGRGARTAFHEHLIEATMLVKDREGCCRLHFTVPPEARDAFSAVAEKVSQTLRAHLDVTLEVSFSIQNPATDTIAVDLENQPFRAEDGSLLFRPGGHGALLENLQGTGGDLVLVKNIDNILPEDRQGVAVRWKHLVTGLLAELERELHHWCREVETCPDNPETRAGALGFLAERLGDPQARELAGGAADSQLEHLRRRLPRPLRVCGVVPNQGEPGGGPFWVTGRDGAATPQIVEASQVDTGDPGQQAVLSAATHFNPVDLACALRDHQGQPHDLRRFVDPDTVFIACKSAQGRELKALERPGLWNGAMADWHTIFVEVPVETFAPVKTVFDLLRPEHQPPD